MYNFGFWGRAASNSHSHQNFYHRLFFLPRGPKCFFITSFLQPRARFRLDSSPLLCSANQVLHIPLAVYCLHTVYIHVKLVLPVYSLPMKNCKYAVNMTKTDFLQMTDPTSRQRTRTKTVNVKTQTKNSGHEPQKRGGLDTKTHWLTDWLIVSRNGTWTYCQLCFLNPPPPQYIHPEDGDCKVCRNVGKPAIFDVAYPHYSYNMS
jgi:hypothetical protein